MAYITDIYRGCQASFLTGLPLQSGVTAPHQSALRIELGGLSALGHGEPVGACGARPHPTVDLALFHPTLRSGDN